MNSDLDKTSRRVVAAAELWRSKVQEYQQANRALVSGVIPQDNTGATPATRFKWLAAGPMRSLSVMAGLRKSESERRLVVAEEIAGIARCQTSLPLQKDALDAVTILSVLEADSPRSISQAERRATENVTYNNLFLAAAGAWVDRWIGEGSCTPEHLEYLAFVSPPCIISCTREVRVTVRDILAVQQLRSKNIRTSVYQPPLSLDALSEAGCQVRARDDATLFVEREGLRQRLAAVEWVGREAAVFAFLQRDEGGHGRSIRLAQEYNLSPANARRLISRVMRKVSTALNDTS